MQTKESKLRLTASLALATGAAFAFSFAVDLLLGGLIGLYPNTAYFPVMTWSVLSIIAVLAARAILPSNRLLAIPYVVFGFLAILGGAVAFHTHPHDFVVAGLMFLQAYLLRKCAWTKGL